MSDFANRLAYRFLALPVLDAGRVRGLLPALRARGALDAFMSGEKTPQVVDTAPGVVAQAT